MGNLKEVYAKVVDILSAWVSQFFPFFIESPTTSAFWSFHFALMLMLLVSLLIVGFFGLLLDVMRRNPHPWNPVTFSSLQCCFWFGAESSVRFPVGLAYCPLCQCLTGGSGDGFALFDGFLLYVSTILQPIESLFRL